MVSIAQRILYVYTLTTIKTMTTICKGCGGTADAKELNKDIAMNSLSRYGHGYICSECGMREAFEGDFIKYNAKYDAMIADDRKVLDDEQG